MEHAFFLTFAPEEPLMSDQSTVVVGWFISASPSREESSDGRLLLIGAQEVERISVAMIAFVIFVSSVRLRY